MKPARLNMRAGWLRLHLYLALSLGLFFALLGLTGSLSLYGETFDRWLNPSLTLQADNATAQSLDDLMAVIKRAYPELKGSWTLDIPRTATEPLTAWYETPTESAGRYYAPLMLSLNPYTGTILARRIWGETARTWLLDLHTQLHMGRFGQQLVGWLGLALIVSVVSGLYLWWPGLAGLRRAFHVNHTQGLHRFALDLHRLMGILGFAALLILAFTGFNLVYPALGEAIVGTTGMGHGDDGPVIRSTGMASTHRSVGLAEAILIGRGPFPKAEVRQLTTPDGPEGTYRITFRQRFEASDRHPMTAVWVDQYSGQIREVRNAARFTTGETALTLIWPLHTGEMLGAWGRLAWFLAGLMLPLLYVSGLLRWLIGRGSIPDRVVDFRPVRQAVTRYRHRFAGWLAETLRHARPWLIRAWQHTLKTLDRLLKQALTRLARLREKP